ncbi:MAG: cell division protein FtsK [Flavobacteriales bacterium]|nr:cell division protein FtsK [Flavobacteriales bacterium]
MVKKKKDNIIKRTFQSINSFSKNERVKKIAGLFFLVTAIFLVVSFVSYIFNGRVDQDKIGKFTQEIQNFGGSLGHSFAHQFIYNWFGISSFLFPFVFLLLGIKLIFEIQIFNLRKSFANAFFTIVWTSICLSFFTEPSILGGVFGFQMNIWLSTWLGKIGTGLLLFFSLSALIVAKFNPTLFQKKSAANELEEEIEEEKTIEEPVVSKVSFEEEVKEEIPESVLLINDEPYASTQTKAKDQSTEENGLAFEVNQAEEEETLSQKEIKNKLEELGDYDPTLDLSNYKIPSVKLLNDYGSGKIEIDKKELEANKNRIVETLGNYKIGIASISATVGPTITLYEIVPEAGVRISKIKNLEDDIALSLSALGIRIIAPIPGRGTIGIEVPNQNPATVSMKAVLSSDKFQNSEMELPVALGKTISNETFVADLAKMPHLLMAGATGQGKSVGLNAILASLLYKKHPSQVKFVLVDPKKVELTLFNKIERHFLAKLPDTDEAIITDTKKVINTLNSLCIEMDQRYDLLQNAQCRNIVEYNKKFIARKLNPNDGHRYLPYIVLVIDEFADLIMTAGKEVETPIARLAQLARAIGIHLIVATQRPSVNVITGIIKANFPARIAFRVTSKIDSRTILDAGGADQLIGRGDMLIALGSELTRIQCAFIDTPEVEKVTDFIGNQRAYPEAFLLPEYVGDVEGGNLNADLDDRDVMFEDAARVVVMNQSGSTSLIQRKLKLGYNRAGRIIDQLEAAGIVGPFEGSKARQVLISDDMALEELLNNLNNKDNA